MWCLDKLCEIRKSFRSFSSAVPACEPGKEAIMIFDNICEVKDNYDHRLMELLVKHAPAFTVPLDEDAENVFMH